jgi:hypothetical protein
MLGQTSIPPSIIEHLLRNTAQSSFTRPNAKAIIKMKTGMEAAIAIELQQGNLHQDNRAIAIQEHDPWPRMKIDAQ